VLLLRILTLFTDHGKYNNLMSNDNQELKIEDIKVGTGPEVKDGDHVIMHYTGWLEDGTKFDSSHDRGEPFETAIGVGYVIKGWDMGVPGMKVGGKRKLTIPYQLGYGKYGVEPDIPGFATLIFEVELIAIK
jgi:FKBP-type peptidyl-prolyl cis-trans isomerase